MFIIWGSCGRQKKEGTVNHVCIICHEARLEVISIRRWFTFFFIPIFPCGFKKFYLSCSECENCYTLKKGINVAEFLQQNACFSEKEL
jgi:hypothetical protein